jgi:Uma2 family endonuclease
MSSASLTRPVTAEELLVMQGEGRRELIEGVVREMPPAGGDHGTIAGEIGGLLREYRRAHGGRIFGAETGFMLARSPDTVRAPDAAYVSEDHAKRVGASPGYWPGAPDLAVEVVSPSDTYTEVHVNALAWLAGGASVVLVVDPAARQVTRYRAADDLVVLAGEQPVDCAPAMPGFAPPAEALLLAR